MPPSFSIFLVNRVDVQKVCMRLYRMVSSTWRRTRASAFESFGNACLSTTMISSLPPF
jgi:hypothetical protein